MCLWVSVFVLHVGFVFSLGCYTGGLIAYVTRLFCLPRKL